MNIDQQRAEARRAAKQAMMERDAKNGELHKWDEEGKGIPEGFYSEPWDE